MAASRRLSAEECERAAEELRQLYTAGLLPFDAFIRAYNALIERAETVITMRTTPAPAGPWC